LSGNRGRRKENENRLDSGKDCRGDCDSRGDSRSPAVVG